MDSRLYLSQHHALMTAKAASSLICAVKEDNGYKLQIGTFWLDKKKIIHCAAAKIQEHVPGEVGPSPSSKVLKNLTGQGPYKPALALMLVLIRKVS